MTNTKIRAKIDLESKFCKILGSKNDFKGEMKMSSIEYSLELGKLVKKQNLVTGEVTEEWVSFYLADDYSSVGFGARIHIYNNTNKTIKYATFVLYAYNAVGDAVQCERRKKYEAIVKMTGPINPCKRPAEEFGNLWYNKTIEQIVLYKVILEYMDGSSEEILGKDLDLMFKEGSAYLIQCEKDNKTFREEREKREAERKRREAEREKREAEERAKKAKIEAEQKAERKKYEAEREKREAEQKAILEKQEAEEKVAREKREAEERAKKAKIEAEKKAALKKRRIISVAILAVVAIALVIGLVVLPAMNYNASNFSVNVSDIKPEQNSYNQTSVIVYLDVTNNGSKSATTIYGYLTISDKNGNVLSEGEVELGYSFMPIEANSTNTWDLTWTMPTDANSQKIYSGDFNDFVFDFEINEIVFENGKTVTVK